MQRDHKIIITPCVGFVVRSRRGGANSLFFDFKTKHNMEMVSNFIGFQNEAKLASLDEANVNLRQYLLSQAESRIESNGQNGL